MDVEPSSPHDGLFLVLPYLDLLELLSMARVCKSLRDAVREDIVPGQKLIVGKPLSFRLTDDRLAELAAKSEGRVEVLALFSCYNIRDDGLLRFVLSNPKITELHVPNCGRLTPEGLIRVARHLKLKKLRIEGVSSCIKWHHLQTLHQLLEIPSHHRRERIFYHRHLRTERTTQFDHAIDMDICPKCGNTRTIFDCTRVSCGNKCRACIVCTKRCLQCGACLAG